MKARRTGGLDRAQAPAGPGWCGPGRRALSRQAEWVFYIGQGGGDRPVILSLRDDSPPIAVSAETGAG
ncbi:hypothetical protein Vse01_41350 [Micromonospora sediminimaris]|uniref:Uncharacterized protein n=1 Tax=Micromonospora sediminimaris TaxID=547162 RepID=A0A9W5USY3_9ACTN|nr:hypothetical protein Vse01_41350 [Micromonospora sediminimaris]